MRTLLTLLLKRLAAAAVACFFAATVDAGSGAWIFLGRSGTSLIAVNVEGGASHAPPLAITRAGDATSCGPVENGRLLVGPPGRGRSAWLAFAREGNGVALVRVDERCRAVERTEVQTRHRPDGFSYGMDARGRTWLTFETVSDRHYLEAFARKAGKWVSVGVVAADVLAAAVPYRDGVAIGWWRFRVGSEPVEWRGKAPLEAVRVFAQDGVLLAARIDGRHFVRSDGKDVPPPFATIDSAHPPELIATTGDEPVVRWGDVGIYRFARLHGARWIPIASIPIDAGFGGMVVYDGGALVSIGGTAAQVDVVTRSTTSP